MSRHALAVATLLLCASLADAQQPSQSYTQMILGAGVARVAPVVTVGFETKQADSPLAWRVMAEYGEHRRGLRDLGGSGEHLYGVHILRVRGWRAQHRFQPYLLAGAGVSHEGRYFTPHGASAPIDDNVLRASLIWGTGMRLAIRGMSVFTEMKLPVPSRSSYPYGPYAPLTFGIRF